MKYNFDQPLNRRETESAKWRAYDADVLPMWVADMDFVSPEPVIRCLQERIAHGVFGYPTEPQGLREAFAAWLHNRHAWDVSPEAFVFIPGVVTGFNMAAHAVVNPGEGLLIQPPVYMPFLNTPEYVGAQRIDAPLIHHPDGHYTVDYEAFENAILESPAKVSLFLLCSPHNPVGHVYSRDELTRMAEICLRHDVLICSDEIHADLTYCDECHIPFASLDPEISRRTISLFAPSKTFNIAGLSCSIAVIEDAELRKRFMQADRGLVHGVNALGLVAATAAYQEGAEWLDQVMAYLKVNRDTLYDIVQDSMPSVVMHKPAATYLAWLDCRGAGLEKDAAKFFLDHARVAVSEGAAFGQGGEGFVRLNFGCPRPQMVDALERMALALRQHAPQAAD